MTKRDTSKLRLLAFAVIAIIDVAAVAWGFRVLGRGYDAYKNPPPLPPDPRMDTVMARHAVYFGMDREQLGKVYILPVQFEGADSAWVPVSKTPTGHSEVGVVRKGRGWVKTGTVRSTGYPEPQP